MIVGADLTLEFKNLVIIAIVVVLAMVLGYRLMNRDQRVWRTRWGFFVERDRYADNDENIETETEIKEWPKREEHP